VSVTDAWFEGQRGFQNTQKQNREEENVSEIYFKCLRQLLIITRSHGKGQWRPTSHRSSRLRVGPFCFFFYYYEKTIASTERKTIECAVLSLDSNEFIVAVLVANFYSVV